MDAVGFEKTTKKYADPKCAPRTKTQKPISSSGFRETLLDRCKNDFVRVPNTPNSESTTPSSDKLDTSTTPTTQEKKE